MSSSVDREQSHREASRAPAVKPLSREASDVMPTPTVRKTDVRTETQPNGSEVTTTIMEFTDQVNYIFTHENIYGGCVSDAMNIKKKKNASRNLNFVGFRITESLAWVKFVTPRDRVYPL